MRILLRACLLVETRWQSRGVSVGGHALAVKPAKASCARITVRWRRRSSRPITKQAFAPPPPFEGGNFRQRPNISRTNLNFRPVRAKKTTAANIARVAPLEPLPPCHHNVEHAPATRGNGNGWPRRRLANVLPTKDLCETILGFLFCFLRTGMNPCQGIGDTSIPEEA